MAVETLRPDSTVAITGWSPGQATAHATIDDAVDESNTDTLSTGAEYISTAASGDEFTCGLGGFTLGSDVVSQAVVWVRWRGNVTIELRDSSNVLASVSINSGGTVMTSSATYNGTLTQQQIDDLRVRVVSNGAQSPAARVGWAFAYVTHEAGAAPPENTVAPAVTGTTTEGEDLSCSTGTWTNTPTGHAYQYQRDDGGGFGDISGATSSTYTLQAEDVGAVVRCVVTASNAAGDSDPEPSNEVGPIAAAGGAGGEDTFVRVAGGWVESDRVVRVAGVWV